MVTIERNEKAAAKTTVLRNEFQNVELSAIRISPLNYRKIYDQTALEDFASELTQHGIISPVTLRASGKGYELVAGERRFRAAGIAGLKEIPAVIRELTDAEVTELQLAENLQRENPHPMDEANAVSLLLKLGNSIEETAKRLGKSKAFVYNRMKLAELIEPIREMFVNGKLTLNESIEIAGLSHESQQEFFDNNCRNWKSKSFRIYNFQGVLSGYRYNLKRAPFNTKDDKLVAEVGSCTACPFNSATLKTLFPELAKEATCSNSLCFRNKCKVNVKSEIQRALESGKPDTLVLHSYNIPDDISAILDSVEGIKGIPQLSNYDISRIRKPEAPVKGDFMVVSGKRGGKKLDKTEYEVAVAEYHTAMEEYNGLIETGKALKGLFISGYNAETILYRKDAGGNDAVVVTAKQVQEAIRSGEATPELLRKEKERMENREQRAKEIDREKVQINLHTAFLEKFGSIKESKTLTHADLVAVRLIIFQTLDWSMRNQVVAELFKGSKLFSKDAYSALSKLNDSQFSYLIRMALAGKSDSKHPGNTTSDCLYKVAIEAGLDVEAIEKQQQEIAEKRQTRLQIRLKELDSHIIVLETQKELPS